MTLWELRQAIESSMPWYAPLGFLGIMAVVFAVMGKVRAR